MSEVGAPRAAAMIKAASDRLVASADELSRLDAVAGDGDHGVNVATAFADANTRIDTLRPDNAAGVFSLVAQAFNDCGAGASGALFGTFFATLGDRLRSAASPDMSDFVDGLELGSQRVSEIGRSKPGDKTMLDALQPAVDAARSAINEGRDTRGILAAAAAAARQGADSTADMRAKAGRARYAATGAVGTRDPGAVTIAVIFDAWAESVALEADSDSAAHSPMFDRGKSRGNPPLDVVRSEPENFSAAIGTDRAGSPRGLVLDSGHFAILALDHVRSFATTMRPDDPRLPHV